MHKILIIEIILVLIIFPTNCEKSSGFYIDNGFNQTILVKVANNKEKEDIEQTLLNIFDLPNKLKRARRSLIVKKSAPIFLQSIYRNILARDIDESCQEDIKELNLSNNIINIIDQSDSIITFSAQISYSDNPIEISRSRRIWFNVSKISEKENSMRAELRLYRDLDKNIEPNEVYNITIYRVAQEEHGKRIKHYINSVKTATGGWISLNISQALEHWINFPEENQGLFLSVRHEFCHLLNYSRVIKPDDIGIVGVSGIPNKQPFIVVFFKKFTFIVDRSETLSKQKRSTEFEKQHHNQNNAHTTKDNTCKINSLYVSFSDYTWQNWIMAPAGYNAYYCSGKCSFPTTTDITSHAVIQSLVHLQRPNEIPNPYCVPTKLSPISTLYFVDDDNIAIKKYRDMVVDSCGCQ